MAQNSDLLFSTDDWVEIHRTADEWEAKLIQTTLGNQQIRCRSESHRGDDRQRRILLFVAPDDRVEALEIVSRIGLVVAHEASVKPRGREAEDAAQPDLKSWSTDELPSASPAAVESIMIADRLDTSKFRSGSKKFKMSSVEAKGDLGGILCWNQIRIRVTPIDSRYVATSFRGGVSFASCSIGACRTIGVPSDISSIMKSENSAGAS